MRMKKRTSKIPTRARDLTRRNTLAVMLNDEEVKALNRFVERYKIKNKSRFVREALMTVILRKMEEDHPTLF